MKFPKINPGPSTTIKRRKTSSPDQQSLASKPKKRKINKPDLPPSKQVPGHAVAASTKPVPTPTAAVSVEQVPERALPEAVQKLLKNNPTSLSVEKVPRQPVPAKETEVSSCPFVSESTMLLPTSFGARLRIFSTDFMQYC